MLPVIFGPQPRIVLLDTKHPIRLTCHYITFCLNNSIRNFQYWPSNTCEPLRDPAWRRRPVTLQGAWPRARPFPRQRLWDLPLTRLLSVPSGLVSAVWGEGVGGLWTDAMLEGRGDNFNYVSTDRLKLELQEEMHLKWVGDQRALPPGVGVTATPPTLRPVSGGWGGSRAQGRSPWGRCDSCRVTDIRAELVTSESSIDSLTWYIWCYKEAGFELPSRSSQMECTMCICSNAKMCVCTFDVPVGSGFLFQLPDILFSYYTAVLSLCCC